MGDLAMKGRTTAIRMAAALLGAAGALLGVGGAVFAQPPSTTAAQIVASGTADIRVPPTKATFTIGILTEASTAAQAGADNARAYQAVDQALRRAHLEQQEIAGSRLTVYPRWDYDQATHRQRRTGFQADHTLEITTTRLDRLGAYIDAALSAGAASVSAVDFSVDDPAAARHRALAEAVRNARADAQAMARAAGGSLGELLELGTEQGGMAPGVPSQQVTMAAARRMAPESVATSMFPSEIEITARVVARWRFTPGR